MPPEALTRRQSRSEGGHGGFEFMFSMAFDLVFRNSTKNRRFSKAFFERILSIAEKSLKLKKAAYEISISLVGEQRIRSLNKQYRNKDKVTDVLSFPLGGEDLAGYNKKALGDLFLCVPFAERTAREEGMTLDAKLAWMTVHGLLHMLGYDHERSEHDAQKMSALEKKILKSIDNNNHGKRIHHRRD